MIHCCDILYHEIDVRLVLNGHTAVPDLQQKTRKTRWNQHNEYNQINLALNFEIHHDYTYFASSATFEDTGHMSPDIRVLQRLEGAVVLWGGGGGGDCVPCVACACTSSFAPGAGVNSSTYTHHI